eukprot:gene4214-4463_t
MAKSTAGSRTAALLVAFAYASSKHIINKLQQQLEAKQLRYAELAQVNHELKAREKVLLGNVIAQSDNLHYLALATLDEPGLSQPTTDSAFKGMATSLVQDIKVQELLNLIGDTPLADQPYSTRIMHAACGRERVKQIKRSSLEDIVTQLRRMTSQLSVILHVGFDSAAALLTNSLEEVLDKYAEMACLLHLVADKTSQALGTMNLDTMMEQEPPADHWHKVLDAVQLRQEQIQHLRTAFQIHHDKAAPLVKATHELCREMQDISMADNTHNGLPITPESTLMPQQARGNEAAQACPAAMVSGAHGLGPMADGLLSKIMQLQELHRIMTFQWINTLDRQQNAVCIVKSYPFWTRTLTLVKLLMEQESMEVIGCRDVRAAIKREVL